MDDTDPAAQADGVRAQGPPSSLPDPAVAEVLESAAQLQRLIPDAVLVGGSAAAFYVQSDGGDGGAMTLSFRNVDAEVTDPVASWPQEALQTALECGDITHWRRIVAEIGRSPWGPVARTVQEILAYSQPYGVAPLMERAISRARARAVASEVDEVVTRIRSAREASGLLVKEFAAEVGTSASRMSTYLSGRVTPSAAMLVRMERLAARRPVK